MDDAFLGADPAQLAVAHDLVPERAEIVGQRLEAAPDDHRRERLDRRDAQLVAPAAGKCQAVALEAGRVVGLKHDVGRRVIGGDVHRVGSVQLVRGRKSHVRGDGSGDRDRHAGSPGNGLGGERLGRGTAWAGNGLVPGAGRARERPGLTAIKHRAAGPAPWDGQQRLRRWLEAPLVASPRATAAGFCRIAAPVILRGPWADPAGRFDQNGSDSPWFKHRIEPVSGAPRPSTGREPADSRRSTTGANKRQKRGPDVARRRLSGGHSPRHARRRLPAATAPRHSPRPLPRGHSLRPPRPRPLPAPLPAAPPRGHSSRHSLGRSPAPTSGGQCGDAEASQRSGRFRR